MILNSTPRSSENRRRIGDTLLYFRSVRRQTLFVSKRGLTRFLHSILETTEQYSVGRNGRSRRLAALRWNMKRLCTTCWFTTPSKTFPTFPIGERSLLQVKMLFDPTELSKQGVSFQRARVARNVSHASSHQTHIQPTHMGSGAPPAQMERRRDRRLSQVRRIIDAGSRARDQRPYAGTAFRVIRLAAITQQTSIQQSIPTVHPETQKIASAF